MASLPHRPHRTPCVAPNLYRRPSRGHPLAPGGPPCRSWSRSTAARRSPTSRRSGRSPTKVAAAQALGQGRRAWSSRPWATPPTSCSRSRRRSRPRRRGASSTCCSRAGERISMALLSMALHERGRRRDQLHRQPVGHHHQRRARRRAHRRGAARSASRTSSRAARSSSSPGYQGVSPRKEVTTLGRGGSDTTAVALAAALGARLRDLLGRGRRLHRRPARRARRRGGSTRSPTRRCRSWPQAGAKVLNAQAVEFAKEKGIAIHARSTFGGAGGDGGARRRRTRSGSPGSPRRRSSRSLALPSGALPAVLERLEGRGAVAAEIAMPGRDGGARARARQRARLAGALARAPRRRAGDRRSRTRGSARSRWSGPGSPPAIACCAR